MIAVDRGGLRCCRIRSGWTKERRSPLWNSRSHKFQISKGTPVVNSFLEESLGVCLYLPHPLW